jgi:integrase
MASLTKINGRYHVRVRRKGFKAQCRTFTHKADALKWVRQIEIGLEQGRVVSRDATLGSLIDRYIEQVSTKKKSHKKERSRLLRLRQSNLGDLYVSKITPAVIAEYRDARLKQVQPATCLRDLNLLSHVFTIAMREWGYQLPCNPVSQIRKPPASKPRTRRLEKDEEKRLLDALAKSRSPWAKPLVIVAIETGMRRGEILSLRWENVSLAQSYVHLPDTKNGNARDVPLSTLAKETLAELPRDISGRVFPMHFEALKSLWKRICRNLDIEDLRFHDLRHEATSRFFEKGLNVMEVATITGHKDTKMLSRYTHLRAEDLSKKLG